jgi:hypothetical protein
MEKKEARSLAELRGIIPEIHPLVTPKLTGIVFLRSSKYERSIDFVPPED